MEGKKKRVNITLSEDILLSIDKHASIRGLSRSSYISQLESMENIRLKKYLDDYKTDSYYDLPLDTPYLKAIFEE